MGRAGRRPGLDRSTLVRAIVKQYLNSGDSEEACLMEAGRAPGDRRGDRQAPQGGSRCPFIFNIVSIRAPLGAIVRSLF